MRPVTHPSPRLVAGRYRLCEVLGRGTMGAVWSARDEVLGRPVAVKELLLPPGIPDAEAEALRERSLREARAIAALSHPNVVTLYDVVREGAAPFVVMELVPSRSLADLLVNGPLPEQQVIAIGAAVAAALQAAHAAGITHRDVKPGNVLVADDGRIKLTDFGIARNAADETLTATGLMLGSPAYMAPEIASGGSVRPASDLWGLGATLFAAVEGRPPYDAGTPMATVACVVQDEVPKPSCTGPLAEVISGLMVKDPALRMPLSRVRQLLGAPPAAPEPLPAGPAMGPLPAGPAPPSAAAPAAVPVPGRRRSGRLAAEPGPLPFAPRSAAAPAGRVPRAGRRRIRHGGRVGRGIRWALAVLLFLAAALTSFGLVRLAAGQPALPVLAIPVMAGPGSGEEALAPRVVQMAEADGARPARFSVSVPLGWLEFREVRAGGDGTGVVARFVSPDGSEAVAVERVGGALLGGSADQYLDGYLRRLAQAVPELVETQRQRLPGGAVDATFRTQEGGELRRTTYLRVLPARPDLWVVSVTVPTEREAAGRTKLFEPVIAAFVPAL